MDKRTEKLMAFLDNSPSVYHAVESLSVEMKNAGYTRLLETEKWSLVPGGKYYMVRGGSALIAFRIPGTAPRGFMMSASHADRPALKIKENSEQTGTYTRLTVENYGGMLTATMLDRPMSIAGRVMVETENGVTAKLVNIDRNLLMIPNVAIHMNRKANDGYTWNPVMDTIPLLGGKDAKGKLEKLLEEAAGGKILGHDLYLYNRQRAAVWGIDEEYISAAALDDLQCVWGCTQGFLNASESGSIPVLCAFDSEEVGSNSVQGAASTLLTDVLERICDALELDLRQMLAQSFMVSADNAHAIHPNHPELADAANAPVMGGGVVMKFNASQHYTTDGISSAIMRKVCALANVPVQTYCNRPDIRGGTTLGHISLTHISVPSVDIGLPQLAMHSSYETAGVQDSIYLEEAMAAYYSRSLKVSADGGYELV